MITDERRQDYQLTLERSVARRQWYLDNPDMLARELKNLTSGEEAREARRWRKWRK